MIWLAIEFFGCLLAVMVLCLIIGVALDAMDSDTRDHDAVMPYGTEDAWELRTAEREEGR